MMRVGVLSQWFPPEAANLVWSLCSDLTDRGHEVKALTGFPNYPAGRIYPGYRQRWGSESWMSGVAVRRMPLYASHDAVALRRAANYLSFAASSTASCKYLADCDVVYVYATPVTAAAAAVAAHRLYRTPYVLHVQDLWPDSVTESGMVRTGRIARGATAVMTRALRRLYTDAAHVIAIAPTMADTLRGRGAPADRVSVVYNWAADESAERTAPDPAVRSRLGRPGRTLAVYAGSLGSVQGLDTVVRAAARSDADGVPVDVAVLGSGTERAAIERLIGDLACDNVRLLDPVPMADMPAIYAAADYQLVTLKDRPVFRGTIPSKLASALSRGCPIITTIAGDVSDMCHAGEFGFATAPDDVEALVKAFYAASVATVDERRKMAQRAEDFYRTQMSRRAALDSIEDILHRAAGARGKAKNGR